MNKQNDDTILPYPKINNFKIIKKIGEGASSIVYKAINLNLNRVVALKILKLHLYKDIEESILERFKREGEILAKLNTPNVVTVYSMDIDGPVKYIEMEYINGTTLNDILLKLNERDFLGILKEILEALKIIHNNNIIIRDLKTDNIMIDQKNRRVVIIDFGLSKYLNGFNKALTNNKNIIGTPMWLSPEVFEGCDKVNKKSDTFSIGLILYSYLNKSKYPFDNITTYPQLYYELINIENKIKNIKDEYKYILKNMLSVNPDKRSDLNILLKELELLINKKNDKGYDKGYDLKDSKIENIIKWFQSLLTIKNIIGFLLLLIYFLKDLILGAFK